VGEAAGQDDRVDRAQVRIAVPDDEGMERLSAALDRIS